MKIHFSLPQKGVTGGSPPAGNRLDQAEPETIDVARKSNPSPKVETKLDETKYATQKQGETKINPANLPPPIPDCHSATTERKAKTKTLRRRSGGKARGSVQMRLRLPRSLAGKIKTLKPIARERILIGFWTAFQDQIIIDKFQNAQAEMRRIGANLNQSLARLHTANTTENEQNLVAEIGRLADFIQSLGGSS